MPSLTVPEFVARCRASTVSERAGYQEHFRDLCALMGHPTPMEADPTGNEPAKADSPTVKAIADAARRLVELRDTWLNPEGVSEAELKKRTLTNLYNQRPTWLDNAHRKLDEAVATAYAETTGEPWSWPMEDGTILEKLLALNRKRC